MKFSRRIALLIIVSLVFLAGVGRSAEGQGVEQDSLAGILPSDVYVFFRTPASSTEMPGYEQTVLKQIFANSEMAAFLKDWESANREFYEEIAKVAQLEVDFVSSLFKARRSGALIDLSLDDSGSITPTWVMSVKLEGKPDKKQLFGAIKAAINKTIGAQSAGGVTLEKVAWEERWPGGHNMLIVAGASPVRFVLLGDMLLIYQGVKSDHLKSLLKNYSNPLQAKTLARNPLYSAAAVGAEAGPAMSFLYVNAARLHGLLRGLNFPKATRLMDVLGLSGVQAMGLAGGFYKEGIRHSLHLYAPRERRGILKVFSMGSGAESDAVSMTKDVKWVMSARTNLAELNYQLPLLIDSIEEVFGRKTRIASVGWGKDKAILGGHVDELLDTLGNSMVIEPGPSGTVFRFGRARPDDFYKVMLKIEQSLGKKFSSLAVKCADGHMRVVRYFNRSGKPIPVAPSYCRYGRRSDGTGVVYLATCPQALKAFLRDNNRKILADSADFKRVLDGMGSGYSMFMYVDNRESYQVVYDMMLPVLNAWTAVHPSAPDPGKLPPGNELASYMFGLGIGVKNSPQGITLTAYSPLGMNGFTFLVIDKLLASNPTNIAVLATEGARLFGADEPASADNTSVPGVGTGSRIPGIGGE